MLNIFDDLGGIACHDGVGRHILGHHGIGTDDAAIAEVNAWQDGGSDAYPHIVLDDDFLPVGGGAVLGGGVVVDGDEIHLRTYETRRCPVRCRSARKMCSTAG